MASPLATLVFKNTVVRRWKRQKSVFVAIPELKWHFSSTVQPSTSGAEGKQVGSSSGSSDDDVIARKRRAEAAAERRAKIMAQMNKAQQKFATKNAIDLSKLPEDGASTGKGGNRSGH